MKRFLLGIIIGAAIVHFAEERKKKMAIEDLKAAGVAVGNAAESAVDVVASAAGSVTGTGNDTAAS